MIGRFNPWHFPSFRFPINKLSLKNELVLQFVVFFSLVQVVFYVYFLFFVANLHFLVLYIKRISIFVFLPFLCFPFSFISFFDLLFSLFFFSFIVSSFFLYSFALCFTLTFFCFPFLFISFFYFLYSLFFFPFSLFYCTVRGPWSVHMPL